MFQERVFVLETELPLNVYAQQVTLVTEKPASVSLAFNNIELKSWGFFRKKEERVNCQSW